MKLTDQIESLRVKMVDDHNTRMHDVERLGQRIFEHDCDLMRSLEAIVHGQEHRARDIVGYLQIIADRIGHVPPVQLVAHDPQPAAIPARPPVQPPPLPAEEFAHNLFDQFERDYHGHPAH